MNYSSITQS